jgi:predicted DNA-binding protein with PD1-like motif
MNIERRTMSALIEDFASGRVKRVIVAKVKPDSDLLSALEEIALTGGIRAGIILSCTGSLKKATLRQLKVFPKDLPPTDKQRLFKIVENGPLEILSVSGNISRQSDRSVVHAHVVVSVALDGEIVVLGGHLTNGNITYLLVEVAIAELEGIEMIRFPHPSRKTLELNFARG